MFDLIGFWVSVSLITVVMVLPLYCIVEMAVCAEIERLTDKRVAPEPPITGVVFKFLEWCDALGFFIMLGLLAASIFGVLLMINGVLISRVSELAQTTAPFTGWLIIPIGYMLIANKVVKPFVLKMLSIKDKINKL